MTFSEMLRLSSCARLLMIVMRSSSLPIKVIQNNDEPPCTPCLSLSKYSSEAARDKASTKREGVHLHPLGGDFAPPKLDKFCHFSICSISQYGFFKISLPTPIKSAALFFRRVSASSKVLTPPVSMTGMETAFL